MKHSHWSFKASTETFDGRRAVKEAWAAGLQVVAFETETCAVTLATDEFTDRLRMAGVELEIHAYASNGYAWIPVLLADKLDAAQDYDGDLPPYVYSMNHTAGQVREMIAKLRKPQRVAVSGYGPVAAVADETAASEHAPAAPFVWQGDGVYLHRGGDRVRVRERGDLDGGRSIYLYADESGDTYCKRGQYYAACDGGPTTARDFVGGKVADL